jgi:ABC-type phosphate/phosphonate transport system substrate-binding protein
MGDENEVGQERFDLINHALNDPDVEFIYANGFTFFAGNSDVGIILQTNNKPHKVLNISYTLAKTLYTKLQTMITDLEESTDNEIMTTDVIADKFLQRHKEDNK